MTENNTMESINDINLEVEVTDMLHKAKVPANIKGYNYLRTAIMLSVNNAEMVSGITKLLYPEVAKRYQATSSRVERAIRHAIEIAFDRGAGESLSNALCYDFSYKFGSDKFKPTNSEFIAAIADHLRLKSKTRRSGHYVET